MINNIDSLKRDALIMANARRLIKSNKSTSNGILYRELFGTGHATGRQCCRELGLDPDCNKTSYNNMCAHINNYDKDMSNKSELIKELVELIDKSGSLDLVLEVRDFSGGIGTTYTQDTVYLKHPNLEENLTKVVRKVKEL